MANASPEDAQRPRKWQEKKCETNLAQDSGCRFDHLLGKTPQDCSRIRHNTFTKFDLAKISAVSI